MATTLTLKQGLDGYTGTLDTFIRRDNTARRDLNQGGASVIQVQHSGNEMNPFYKAGFIEFDISGVPAGQTIQTATLRMYLHADLIGGGVQKKIEVHNMLSDILDYGTGDNDSQYGTVTYNHLVHSSVDWGPPVDDAPVPDADFDSTVITAINTVTADVDSWIEFDITDLVSDWHDGSLPNYGMYLYPGNDQTALYFRSSEYATATERPELVIEYFIPTCGDFDHPYPLGDLSKNCYVDLEDIMLFAQYWLDCTDPHPPCNFVP